MAITITDRIFEASDKMGLKSADLSRLMKVTPGFISNCRNRNENFSEKQVMKFLVHFQDVDANYILHGKTGKKYDNSKTENEAMVNEPSPGYVSEIEHYRMLISEKDKQIELLQKLLEK